jgi:3-hydroxyacyl-CoA dehydrogenase
MSDLAGLDVGWRMRKAQGLTAPIADRLCEIGRYGQKTGRGFYLYEPGSRTPKPDAEVERLIADTAAKLSVVRGAIDGDEIVERLLFPMINEGARILAEGIARRPGDIDVIWVHGYGFPVHRGGPMHYADSVGLARIRDRLADFVRKTGDQRHRPAPLVEKLAAEGRGFASLGK